jgi:hypothetical protein
MNQTIVRDVENTTYTAKWFWCDGGYVAAMKKCVEYCEKEEKEVDHVEISSAEEGGFYVTMYFPVYK